jgi:hypothetical protein
MSLCVVTTCRIRGQHLTLEDTGTTGCETACDRRACPGHRDHPDACHGCRPATATWGLLCDRDRSRLARAIVTAPDYIRYLRTQLEPGGAPADGQPRGHRAPPAPLRLDAVDDADQVYAVLSETCASVAAARQLTGPARPGAWYNAAGQLIGVKAETAAAAASEAATWLHAHLDWLSGWAPVADLFADADAVTLASGLTYQTPPGLVRVVEAVAGRWPTASRERAIPGVICPRCDTRGSLVYHPPDEFEAPVTVACHRCAHVIPDDSLGWYARLVEDLRDETPTIPAQADRREARR